MTNIFSGKKAIIFDMDGVIINSERVWGKREGDFLKRFVSNFSPEDHENIIGQSLQNIFLYLQKRFPDEMNLINAEKFLQEYEKFGLEEVYSRTEILPGLLEFLELITEKNLKIALASSAQRSWVNQTLERHKLAQYFLFTNSAGDVKNAKPAPDLFLKTAQDLKLENHECVIIEDSTNGILAANRAQIPVIGILNGFNNQQNLKNANFITEGFPELSKLLS